MRQAEAKREREHLPTKAPHMSREEYEARVWAFMSHKPSDSDMEEDDDDDDEDDGDPSTWFEDDQDDGLKGQDIIYPDTEDISNIIRVDDSKMHYSAFYEPQDEGD